MLRYIAKYGDSGISEQELQKALKWDDTTFNMILQETKLFDMVIELPNSNVGLSDRIKGQIPTP